MCKENHRLDINCCSLLPTTTWLRKRTSFPQRREVPWSTPRKYEGLIPPLSSTSDEHFVHRLLIPSPKDDSVAFQSSLGNEFAWRRSNRPEWNRICEMGFLQSQIWPELTRRFVLIVRANRQSPGSSTALAWRLPHGFVEKLRWRKRQTRFPFIYFHRHFTDCHTIAPSSLALSAPPEFPSL